MAQLAFDYSEEFWNQLLPGIYGQDDYVNMIKTLASNNPEKKVKASAASDSSQTPSFTEKNSEIISIAAKESALDLKFCFYYSNRGKSAKG